MRLSRIAALVLVAVASVSAARADDTPEATLAALLAANRFTGTWTQAALAGPALDFLLRNAADAQFVAIGEEHNVAEVAQFTDFLFGKLHERYGFNYFADEQDAQLGVDVSRAPLRGSFAKIAAWRDRYPNEFTFAGDEELQLLADVGRVSTGKANRVWALDQIFGVLHVLDRLAALTDDADSRRRIAALIEAARPYETKRFEEKKRYIAEVPAPADLDTLAQWFKPRSRREAEFLMAQLTKSRRIYRNWSLAAYEKQVTGYESNREREENMKQLFMREYRRAERLDGKQPRVLLKLGHWHLFRGQSPGSVFTLGNFVSDLATSNGSQSFAIAIMVNNGAGSDRDLLTNAAWTKPFVDAQEAGAWTAFDLRPLRGYAHAGRLGTLPPDLRRMIFGFDAVLLLSGAHKATLPF